MDIRRALIVDDSKLVCFKLGKMLEEKGIAAHAVNSGEDALAYLNANPLPDVVFVDIIMPGMDGYQTIEAIRAQPLLAHLPIIMCSSNDTDDDRAQAQRRGANGFLPKPPAADHLLQLLSSLSPVPIPISTSSPVDFTAESAARLTRQAIAAAEQAVNTRMEDLTHRLSLEVEETARRVAGTLAIETARAAAQRTATEIVNQLTDKNIRQVATQAAGDVARTVVAELVPNVVLERMRAIAATTMPALAEQAIQEATAHLAPALLREIAAPTAEATLRAVLPAIQTEVTAGLRENLRADLTHEVPDKVAHAAAALLENESFRLSMTRAVRSVAESIAEQTARTVAESTAHTTVAHALARAASAPSSGEQNAHEALRHIEALTRQLRRVTLALGAGLLLVIGAVFYVGAKLFMFI